MKIVLALVSLAVLGLGAVVSLSAAPEPEATTATQRSAADQPADFEIRITPEGDDAYRCMVIIRDPSSGEVLSAPTIHSRLGEKAEIQSSGGDPSERIHFEVTADRERAEYTLRRYRVGEDSTEEYLGGQKGSITLR